VLGKRGAGRVFREGDFFGEMALLDGEPRSASVSAATELQTMKIPHRPFLKLLEQEPKIAVAMLRDSPGGSAGFSGRRRVAVLSPCAST